MKHVLTLFLVCCVSTAFCQSYFNSDQFWQRLVPETEQTFLKIQKTDTAIVVVSNRSFMYDCMRFGTECVGDSLHYFLVYASGGKWHVLNVQDLISAAKLLPDSNKDWVVYVEGMGKIFTSALDRGMQMAAQYDVNVLYLDYPSYYTEANPLMNFLWVNANAKNSWRYFSPVLAEFQQQVVKKLPEEVTVTMLLHSMGNHFIHQAARHHSLKNISDSPWLDNLVLNAPCIPRSGSKKWLGRLGIAEHNYVHYNSDDGVLKWAKLAAHRELLGHHPKKVCQQATYVNFTELCGTGHSNFLDLYAHPPLKAKAKLYYSAIFHGDKIDWADSLQFSVSAYKGIGYDILPGDTATQEQTNITSR